jgi:hypothetical protein
MARQSPRLRSDEEQIVMVLLRRDSPNGQVGHAEPQVRSPALGAGSRPRGNWFKRTPGWPLIVLLAGWPVWWALGIENRIGTVMAIPALWQMYRWRATRNRTIRLPPGFGLWMLFLIVMLLGAFALKLQAPQTLSSPVSNRVLSFAARAVDYGTATTLLLYAGNLTEEEFPRRRLAFLLGLVGAYAVAGGLLGVVDPHIGFTSPIAHLLPKSFQSALSSSLNPSTAQNQPILGYTEGRVKAPFDYTNTWGECLAILLPWLIVAWRAYGTKRLRTFTIAVLALSIIPIVYSLNRGLWIAVAAAILYLAVRLAAQGRLALLGAVCVGVTLIAIVIVATPLQSLISQRLAHGKSNTGRASLSAVALHAAAASPLIGWGDTRHVQGSASSITVGKTAGCSRCGNKNVGGDGQLQLLLITTGFLGAICYISFFAYGVWRYRRDTTPYGMAGVLVLLLMFLFMFVYEAGGPPLAFTMLAYALLWRNDREMQRQNALSAGEGRPRPPGTGGAAWDYCWASRMTPPGPGRRQAAAG